MRDISTLGLCVALALVSGLASREVHAVVVSPASPAQLESAQLYREGSSLVVIGGLTVCQQFAQVRPDGRVIIVNDVEFKDSAAAKAACRIGSNALSLPGYFPENSGF